MAIRGYGLRRLARLSAIALAVLSPVASASQDPDVDRVLDMLPVRADAAVVVRDAARLRGTPSGAALARLVADAGTLDRTRGAWSGLSRSLGWTDAKAFDEILGTRVIVVLRDPRGDAPEWALLTQVTPDTERRLRQRLAAMPRGNIAGLAVLGVEDGAYEIMVGPAKVIDTPRGERSVVTIVLGPRDSALVVELAPSLRRGLFSVGATGGAEIAAAIRERSPGGEPRRMTLSARTTAAGWNASIVASPGAISVTQKSHSWSDAAFQSLERGSLMAVMGAVDAQRPFSAALRAAGLESLDIVPALPEGSADAVECTAIVLKHVGPLPPRSTVLMADSPDRAGPAAVTPRDPALRPTRLALTYAVRSRDTRAMVLQGDRAIASCVAALQSGDSPADHRAFEMTIPELPARGLLLSELLLDCPEVLEPLVESFGPEPTLRWGMCTVGGLWGINSVPGPGWWSATLAPAGVISADQVASALAIGESGERRPRISTGMMRPAALLTCVGPMASDFLAPLRPLRGIEQLRWDAWVRPDGAVQCDVSLRIAAE